MLEVHIVSRQFREDKPVEDYSIPRNYIQPRKPLNEKCLDAGGKVALSAFFSPWYPLLNTVKDRVDCASWTFDLESF